MKKSYPIFLATVLAFGLLLATSCDKEEDDPIPPPDLAISSTEVLTPSQIVVRYTIDIHGQEPGEEYGIG